MKRTDQTPDQLLSEAQAGSRHAIGRLLTLVELGGQLADEIARLTHPLSGSAQIVGVTGPPGSGKSSLVSQLLLEIIADDRNPAVIAVDPSSPLTGGAILGDRVRIDASDSGAFIRSIATRGHSGGLATAVPGAIRVFEATGYDPIIIETVGVGQVEVDVTATADTTIVVANPGTGDAVQANKAGLLEVADIFVVNKSDHPGANDARRDLELMLDLSHMTGQEDPTGRRPPIIMANSLTGDGASDLWTELVAHAKHLNVSNQLEGRRANRQAAEVKSRIEDQLSQAAAQMLDSAIGQAILGQVSDRDLSPAEATAAIVRQVLDTTGST